MISYTVFQFTQRAIENHSTCHSWHACRRLPTPAVSYPESDESTPFRHKFYVFIMQKGQFQNVKFQIV
jgi:hypothetical protein